MQRSRFGKLAVALFEQVGDILTGKRAEGKGVLDGPCHRILSVDVAEGDDLADVMQRVHATLLKLLVIVVGPGMQSQEVSEDDLVVSLFALSHQGFGMIGQFGVFAAVIASDMTGHQFVLMVDA